jgi:hypothetical protein
MLRHLYRATIRLHPTAFRRRFGGEMLSIFESTKGKSARLGLLFDCLVSSIRQGILRPGFWPQRSVSAAVHAADGIPSFSSLDDFRPRTSAVIDGVILSALLFVVTCFAIRHSWIHVLHVQIRSIRSTAIWGFPPRQVQANYEAGTNQTLNALQTLTTSRA